MALWEFSFDMIDRNIHNMNNRDTEEILSWQERTIDSHSISDLSKNLKKHYIWGENIMFGKNDGTNIMFFYDNNVILEIQINIDLRNTNKYELQKIIKFMNSNNAMIWIDNRACEANMTNLTDEIKNSNAYKFCNDPFKFLEESDKLGETI